MTKPIGCRFIDDDTSQSERALILLPTTPFRDEMVLVVAMEATGPRQ